MATGVARAEAAPVLSVDTGEVTKAQPAPRAELSAATCVAAGAAGLVRKESKSASMSGVSRALLSAGALLDGPNVEAACKRPMCARRVPAHQDAPKGGRALNRAAHEAACAASARAGIGSGAARCGLAGRPLGACGSNGAMAGWWKARVGDVCVRCRETAGLSAARRLLAAQGYAVR